MEARQVASRTASNSLILSLSVAGSWGFAFVGQVALRRVLGDERLGVVSFVESVATLAVVFISLGVDTYIRRHVALDADHARTFARPLERLRLGAGLTIAVVVTAAFAVSGAPGDEVVLAALWAAGQIALLLGQTSVAYLHAVQEVRGVAWAGVAVKALWLAVALSVLQSSVALWAAPTALAVSESVRWWWARRLFRTHIGEPDSAHLSTALTVVGKSMPYYLDGLNITFNRYIVPALLGALATTTESGYYSTAALLMTLPFFFLPVVTWVVPPMFARMQAMGRDQLWLAARRLALSIAPLGVVVAGGMVAFSRLAMTLVNGESFTPAVASFAILSVTFPFTFISVVLSASLVADGRGWAVTRLNFVTFVGMTASAAMAMSLAGTGRGEASAAGTTAVVAWEIVTLGWFWWLCRLGRPPVRTLTVIAVGLAAVAVLLFAELRSGDQWPLRIVAWSVLGVLLPLTLSPVLREGRSLLADRGQAAL
jgi:O-antigen/teichoic acid export membrane protein